MSIYIHVFVHKDRLPAANEWARAIIENGFSVALSTAFDPLTFSGYLPTADEDAGFEYYLDSIAESGITLSETTKPLVSDYDAVVTFRVGGREKDLVVVQAAAATLTLLNIAT